MLSSDLCHYSDAYIVVKGTIDLLATAANENDRAEKNAALRINAPFRTCISTVHCETMQKILILSCQWIIC